MDIDELRTVQTKERQKDSLQHLRDSFYEDVAGYIAELKSRRQEAADAASDPFSDPEVSQLTDEIETAEDVVEAVYERRVGKVVKLASFAAADMPVDEEGLTVQERDLFEDLVGRIGENKDRVLDILAGEGDSGAASTPTGADPSGAAPGAEPTADADPLPHQSDDTAESGPDHSEPAVGMGGTPEHGESEPATVEDDPAPAPEAPPDEPAEEFLGAEPAADEEPPGEPPAGDPHPDARGRPDGGTTEQRTTVRITADVGRVLGMDDREYELRSEDVVSLPEANADALLEREAAEKLERAGLVAVNPRRADARSMLEPGDDAPDFSLPNQDGQTVALSDLDGQYTVVYFYPRADTPGCTIEAEGFRDDWDAYEAAGVSVVGISDDPAEELEAFREKYDLPFDLLSDEEGSVARSYDSFGEYDAGFEAAFRNTFVVDDDGEVVAVYEGVDPEGHADEILSDLDLA